MQKYVAKVKELKQKPEHVRHRIALGTSVGVTALVGVIWLVGSATSGKFALSSPNSSQGTDQQPTPTLSDTKSDFSQLLGSAASAIGATSSQPTITVVDGGTSSTLDNSPTTAAPTAPADATAIPF